MSRKFKRMSSAVTAFCMMAAMAVPFGSASITADAVTWKCGDVDNDGRVTMTDSVQLTKYLNGMVDLVDYTKADTNGDCIVDIVDSRILTMFLGESVTSLPHTRYGGGSRYATVGAQSVNELKNYTVFDAKTGEALDGYALDPNPVVDNSRVAVGEDTRYRDDSLSGVVKIINTDGSFGTGFVVDAHTIATAAHCVFDVGKYNQSYGSFENSNSRIESIVFVNALGSVCKEITDPCEVHVPNALIVNAKNNYIDPSVYGEKMSQYDYALITVSEDLSEYACFDLGITTDGIMQDSRKLYCTGFPKYAVGADVNNEYGRNNRFTGEGYMLPDDDIAPERRLRYDIDTSGGNSGGPVYVKTDVGNTTYYTVIGIHTRYVDYGVSNGGTQMTTELLHFYKNNPYLMW